MSFFQRLAAAGQARLRKEARDEQLRDYYHYGSAARRGDDMYILNKYDANATRYAGGRELQGRGVATQAARQLARQGSSFSSARSSLSRQSSGASAGGLSRQSSGKGPGGMHGVRYSESRKKWVWENDSRQRALESVKPKTHAAARR